MGSIVLVGLLLACCLGVPIVIGILSYWRGKKK